MLTTTATIGFLVLSTPIILFRQRNSGRCTTKSFYDVPSMTKPNVKPQIFIENPNPCTIAIVLGLVAIAYRTSHR
jgi:hypothetical protein